MYKRTINIVLAPDSRCKKHISVITALLAWKGRPRKRPVQPNLPLPSTSAPSVSVKDKDRAVEVEEDDVLLCMTWSFRNLMEMLKVLEMLEVSEVMRCVLLCILEAVCEGFDLEVFWFSQAKQNDDMDFTHTATGEQSW